MQILNDTLLRNSGFVAYNRLSAGDISVAIGLDFAESVAGVVKLEQYPAVGKVRIKEVDFCEKKKCQGTFEMLEKVFLRHDLKADIRMTV